MKAAVFEAPFDIRIEQRERPEPARGEALIEMRAAGVCGGDVYLYLGTSAYVTYPRIAGHEVAGQVVKLGPDTAGPKVGTQVVIEPFIGCGHCYPCRVGKSNCCARLEVIGVHRDGGFADYVIAPVDRLHETPNGLSPLHAAFAEPVAIGVQACRRGAVSESDDALVLGAGPIGLAITEVALARGAKVFITDPDQKRLEAAVQLGGIPLNPGEGLLEQVMRLTDGEGMPVVIEATGNPQAMEATVDLVASGGRIIIVGLAKQGKTVAFPGLDFTRKEMTVIGSRASVGCFPESLDLIARGAIRYPQIATTFALDDAPTVLAQLADPTRRMHKAVFLRESA